MFLLEQGLVYSKDGAKMSLGLKVSVQKAPLLGQRDLWKMREMLLRKEVSYLHVVFVPLQLPLE
jgi:hypothetical protein